MDLTCEDLGLTKEDMQQRLVDTMAERLLGLNAEAEDMIDDESGFRGSVLGLLRDEINSRIKTLVIELGDKEIAPRISALIEGVAFKETNRWGEGQDKEFTFREYLIARAETYMTEKVDHSGKSKAENRHGYFSATTTRVSHMVEKHLHYEIEKAMKEALKTANNAIAGGIEKAVKMKLQEIVAGLKTKVTVTR